jgi:hypothetical protein
MQIGVLACSPAELNGYITNHRTKQLFVRYSSRIATASGPQVTNSHPEFLEREAFTTLAINCLVGLSNRRIGWIRTTFCHFCQELRGHVHPALRFL